MNGAALDSAAKIRVVIGLLIGIAIVVVAHWFQTTG